MRRAHREQDVLRRGLPGRAGDRRRRAPASGRARTARCRRAPRERRRARALLLPRGRAHARRSRAPLETATKRSPSAMRRESICTPVTASAQGRATSARRTARPRRARRGITPSTSRTTCAVVERDAAVGQLHLGVGALARDHDHVARGRASASAVSMAARRSSTISSRPAATAAAIAAGSSRARVVGGDDRAVGELGGDLVPSAAASRGRGRRRRRRRTVTRSPTRARRAGRSRASRACARSRRSQRTAARRRPTRIGPGTPASDSMPALDRGLVDRRARAPPSIAPSAFARLNARAASDRCRRASSSGVERARVGQLGREPRGPTRRRR